MASDWNEWAPDYFSLNCPGDDGSSMVWRESCDGPSDDDDFWMFTVVIGRHATYSPSTSFISGRRKYPLSELQAAKSDAERCLELLREFYEKMEAEGLTR